MSKSDAAARPPFSTPFYYGWFIVALSFLANLTAAGIRSAPSVLIHPLEAEFGWSANRDCLRRKSKSLFVGPVRTDRRLVDRPRWGAPGDSWLSYDHRGRTGRDRFRPAALAIGPFMGRRVGYCHRRDAGARSQHRKSLVRAPARSRHWYHDQRQRGRTSRLFAVVDGDHR